MTMNCTEFREQIWTNLCKSEDLTRKLVWTLLKILVYSKFKKKTYVNKTLQIY